MNARVSGLRVFLLATLRIMSIGRQVSCTTVEKHLADGIATKLFSMFKDEYEECGIVEGLLKPVDDYYKHWEGCADGQEDKYCCTPSDGLQLVIALALNEF